MFRRLLFTLLFMGILGLAQAQKRVFISFPVPVFVDDFKKPDKTWPVMKSSEMYTAYDNGDYYIIRKNPVSPYVLMADWPNTIESFHLKTAVRLAPGLEKNQTVGIVVMASKDGSDGIIIDVNRFRDFRIRRLAKGKYVYITGDESNGGWESSSSLKPRDDENVIELKTHNGEYDLYFNGDYITSFSAHELFSGNFGIFVGPNTKARIPYFHVASVRNTEGETSIKGTNYAEMLEQTIAQNNELKKLINEQKKKIKELTEENPSEITQLKAAIAVLEEQLIESNGRVKSMEKSLVQMQVDQAAMQTRNENLEIQIDTLERQLAIARGDSSVRIIKGSSADQVISMLSNSLEEQMNRNDVLENENTVLRDQLLELSDDYKRFKRLLLDYMKTESYSHLMEMREYALLPFDVQPILGEQSSLNKKQFMASTAMQGSSKTPVFVPVPDPKGQQKPDPVREIQSNNDAGQNKQESNTISNAGQNAASEKTEEHKASTASDEQAVVILDDPNQQVSRNPNSNPEKPVQTAPSGTLRKALPEDRVRMVPQQENAAEAKEIEPELSQENQVDFKPAEQAAKEEKKGLFDKISDRLSGDESLELKEKPQENGPNQGFKPAPKPVKKAQKRQP